jgi:hypothetical protein
MENIKNLGLDQKQTKELEASLAWLLIPENIKKKTRERITNKLKLNDKLCLGIALLGIITNIYASSLYVTFDIFYNYKGEELAPNTLCLTTNEKDTITTRVVPNNSDFVKILRSLTTIFTILLLIFIARHYFLRLRLEIYKQKLDITSNIYSSGMLWKLLAEFAVCIIHSPPFLDNMTVDIPLDNDCSVPVDIDLITSVVIPLRTYLLIRYFSFYSSWADDRAEKICNECNTPGGISFAIKAELKERPYTVVGVLMVMSIIIFGYGLRNFEVAFLYNIEIDKYMDWTFVWNGFWCIIITILTVGYGDFFPRTFMGKMIAVVACLWGTFLISLMVVSLTVSVEFTHQEQKAYEEIKKAELYQELKHRALNLIRYGCMLKNFPDKREDIKDTETKIKYIKILDRFKHTLHHFRTTRKFVISKEHDVNSDTILYKLRENVSSEMEGLIHSTKEKINILLHYLKTCADIQGDIKTNVDTLDKLTKGLHDCIK